MAAAADLTAALAAVQAVAARFHSASEAELIADVELVESIGRVVDGLRLDGAAQLEFRSRKTLGDDSLAAKHGVRDGVELVQLVTGSSKRTARARVGLGSALAGKTGLDGSLLPGRYPVLADAIAAGEVGLDSARLIVDAAQAVRRRATADDLAAMVESLTEIAASTDTEALREPANAWSIAIDPDGPEITHATRRRKRALKLGRTLEDGTTTLSLVLTPEHLAMIKELLQSRKRTGLFIRTIPGGDAGQDGVDPEWREAEGPDGGDPRTAAQHDYDSLIDAVEAGVRAQHDGVNSTAITHETIVTITAAELEARTGQGFTSGVLAGIPVPTIERRACTDGIRLLATGNDGEALYLSRSHRVFSAAQKKALTVAAGNWCQYPGCTTRAPYLEAHHVEWWRRDDGPTDIDNGVMLCTFHHHLVHEPHSPVEIRNTGSDLYFLPTRWRGPLHDHQRAQRGPSADPELLRLRRRHDPARNPFAA